MNAKVFEQTELRLYQGMIIKARETIKKKRERDVAAEDQKKKVNEAASLVDAPQILRGAVAEILDEKLQKGKRKGKEKEKGKRKRKRS